MDPAFQANYRKKKRKPRSKKLDRKTAQAVKNIVQAQLAPVIEKKHKDTSISVSNASTFNQYLNLTAITQGDSDTTRDGDRVTIDSIQLRFKLQCIDSTNVQRLVLVQWHEDTVLANAALSTILQYSSSIPNDIYSPYQIDKNSKFKVLWDRTFTQVLTQESDQISVNVFINKGFKKEIQFTNAASSGVGHIFLLYVSDSTVTAHPTIQGWARVRYYDG